MSVDLSKLEAGDSVEINSELFPVIRIIFCPKDNIIECDLYKVFILDNSPSGYSDWCYRIDGSFLFGFYPITKVVKKWTDDDMKEAYAEGAASASGRTKAYYLEMYAKSWTVFSDWLVQYKSKNK